eukprot:5238868-Pyramimonas_sp.AAC.1
MRGPGDVGGPVHARRGRRRPVRESLERVVVGRLVLVEVDLGREVVEVALRLRGVHALALEDGLPVFHVLLQSLGRPRRSPDARLRTGEHQASVDRVPEL